MIDHAVPAVILASIPGINMLGLETIYLKRCGEGLRQWPRTILMTKWTGIILVIIGIIIRSTITYEDENPGVATTSKVFASIGGFGIVVGIIIAMVVSIGALTNPTYCSPSSS